MSTYDSCSAVCLFLSTVETVRVNMAHCKDGPIQVKCKVGQNLLWYLIIWSFHGKIITEKLISGLESTKKLILHSPEVIKRSVAYCSVKTYHFHEYCSPFRNTLFITFRAKIGPLFTQLSVCNKIPHFGFLYFRNALHFLLSDPT